MFPLTIERCLAVLRACTNITNTSKVIRQRDQTHHEPFTYYVITRVSVCVGVKAMDHDCVICERLLKSSWYQTTGISLPNWVKSVKCMFAHFLRIKNKIQNTMALGADITW